MSFRKAGWRERFWEWLSRRASSVGAWAYSRQQGRLKARALPPGTRIRLVSRGCGCGPADPSEADGVWYVHSLESDWGPDGDYRLTREPDAPRYPSKIACPRSMELAP